MHRKLEKKVVSPTRDRVNRDKAVIFCNVADFLSSLIDDGKPKRRESAGIVAARACGLAYTTYRYFLGGKKALPEPDDAKKKRKERTERHQDQSTVTEVLQSPPFLALENRAAAY